MKRGSLLDQAGRTALAWVFVRAGYDVLRDPRKPAAIAGPWLSAVRRRSPISLPADAAIVRANAATQVGAAALLAAGTRPRFAAGALLASLLPTTLAGHPYWTVADPALRTNQRNHFNKNVAVMGALLLLWTEEGRRRDT